MPFVFYPPLDNRKPPFFLDILDETAIVLVDWFLSNLLPRNDLNIDDVLAQLISNGGWKEGCWSAFPTNPGASELAEDLAFQGFQQVVEAILEAIGHPKANFHYSSQPSGAPAFERDDDPQPDAVFALGNTVAQISATGPLNPKWWDIICPIEFKKSESDDAFMDAAKIIWSMHHIMREDARRRFTFGITIEDTRTCLWFASRSLVLVSKPFDFMKEPEPLIRMVSFLACASEEQLGYDTTMRRIQDSAGEDQLVINIGDRAFQTDEVLADFAAGRLLGHGTRVWRGFFQDDNTPAVLKDCWVECDHRLEGDILTTLRDEYHKLGNSKEHNFDDYFLTMAAHGRTKLTGGVEDDTQAMMNNQIPSTTHCLDLAGPIDDGPRRARRTEPHNFKWRSHYRISFNEVATPLYDVVELPDYMKALRAAMIAIEILHTLGYVHRDISQGNVFFYEGGGRLSDLEYCKPFSELSADDIRAGTLNFMSVEVAAGHRLFHPRRGYGRSGNSAASEALSKFQFFILHDVESVWWLLVFALFCNGVNNAPPDTAREDLQVMNAQDMFPRSWNSTTRRDSFSYGRFAEMKDSLPSSLHPLFDIAEDLRSRLVDGYVKAEQTETLNQAEAPSVLLYFRKKLRKAIKLSKNVTLVPGLKFEHNRLAKRKRSTEEAKEDGGKRGTERPSAE